MENINTKDYWDHRFGSGDWERKGGFSQTRAFAQAQVSRIDLPRDFDGSICDFGCGAGDAFPVYRRHWPRATLIGVDFSASAIKTCKERYGHIASFICGDYTVVPDCDAIIASNVLEHLNNDKLIAQELMKRCRTLCITVPFREKLKPHEEHVNSYTEDSFNLLGCVRTQIFVSPGWSLIGWVRIKELVLKNAARRALGRPLAQQNYQIMFTAR